MNAILKIISPVDGSVYAERPLADDAAIRATLERAKKTQREWRHVPVGERTKIGTAFVDAMVADKVRVIAIPKEAQPTVLYELAIAGSGVPRR